MHCPVRRSVPAKKKKGTVSFATSVSIMDDLVCSSVGVFLTLSTHRLGLRSYSNQEKKTRIERVKNGTSLLHTVTREKFRTVIHSEATVDAYSLQTPFVVYTQYGRPPRLTAF